MGKDLYDKFEEARKVFEEASDASGLDLAGLCFDGPEEELNLTENTQPAILTASLAALAVLRVMNVEPAALAGHSLGELTAVAAAGGLSVGDAARLARVRGRYMQEAVAEGEGLMAAVLGLDDDKVREACSGASALGIVSPANFNSPGQVVISGAKPAVEKASELCREMGAKKVVPLAVSVPSHSMMMAPAAERFREELDGTGFRDLDTAVVSNATARFVTSAADVKAALIEQLTSPLLWVDCVNALAGEGCRVIIEVGPGKVLSGLIKRINKSVEARNVHDETSLNTTLDYLATGCSFTPKK